MKYLLFFVAFVVAGCDRQGLDGTYMRSESGKVFLVTNKAGDLYHLGIVNKKELERLYRFANEDSKGSE